MRLPRMSLAYGLALVALVALNIAAGKASLLTNQAFFNGLVLIVPMVQLAIARTISGRGPRRAFWAAFAVGG